MIGQFGGKFVVSRNVHKFTAIYHGNGSFGGSFEKKRESLSGLKRARWLMCDQLREVWGSLKYKEILVSRSESLATRD